MISFYYFFPFHFFYSPVSLIEAIKVSAAIDRGRFFGVTLPISRGGMAGKIDILDGQQPAKQKPRGLPLKAYNAEIDQTLLQQVQSLRRGAIDDDDFNAGITTMKLLETRHEIIPAEAGMVCSGCGSQGQISFDLNGRGIGFITGADNDIRRLFDLGSIEKTTPSAYMAAPQLGCCHVCGVVFAYGNIGG